MKIWLMCVAGVVLASMGDNARAAFVAIPDSGNFVDYGKGNASVTYDSVVFSQSAALSGGRLFNVGSGFSGGPAVLSSQQQSFLEVANILITLPTPTTAFSLRYGTFLGSKVTFLLSNGFTVTQGSARSGYAVPDSFSVFSTEFTSVLVTSRDYVLNLNGIYYDTETALSLISDSGDSRVVPEPASLAMWGFGTLGFAFARFRRRRCVLAS